MKCFFIFDVVFFEDDFIECLCCIIEGLVGEDDELWLVDDKEQVMKGVSFRRLNCVVVGLIESFSMINYLWLDVIDEDSVGVIFSYVDDCIQYYEVQDFKEFYDDDFEEQEQE